VTDDERELEDLMMATDHMTPDVVRAGAIVAAEKIGAPPNAINNLVEMQCEGEWSLSSAFMDDDEAWFDRNHEPLVEAIMEEVATRIKKMGRDSADAMAAVQRIEVWLAWRDRVAEKMEEMGARFRHSDGTEVHW
jgi:hypothetical protein